MPSGPAHHVCLHRKSKGPAEGALLSAPGSPQWWPLHPPLLLLDGVLPPPGAAHWGQFYPLLRGGCEREVGLGRWVFYSQGRAFQGAERPQLPLPFKRLPIVSMSSPGPWVTSAPVALRGQGAVLSLSEAECHPPVSPGHAPALWVDRRPERKGPHGRVLPSLLPQCSFL